MEILKELVKDIERDLVISLTISVRRGKISFNDSKKIAKEYISYFPYRSYDDLFERLYFLSTKHREVRKVYVKYSPRYYQEKTEHTLAKMRNFLRLKDIEEAVSVARRANYAKI